MSREKMTTELEEWLRGLEGKRSWWTRLRLALRLSPRVGERGVRRIEEHLQEVPAGLGGDPVELARSVDRRLVRRRRIIPGWLAGALAAISTAVVILAVALVFSSISFRSSKEYTRGQVEEMGKGLEEIPQEISPLLSQVETRLRETLTGISGRIEELEGKVDQLIPPSRWDFSGRLLSVAGIPLNEIPVLFQVHSRDEWQLADECITGPDGHYSCQFAGPVFQAGVAKPAAVFRLGLPAGWLPEKGCWLEHWGTATAADGYHWWQLEEYPFGQVLFDEIRLEAVRSFHAVVWLQGREVPEQAALVFQREGVSVQAFPVTPVSQTISFSITEPALGPVEYSLFVSFAPLTPTASATGTLPFTPIAIVTETVSWMLSTTPTVTGTWALSGSAGVELDETGGRAVVSVAGPPTSDVVQVVFVGPFPMELDYGMATYTGTATWEEAEGYVYTTASGQRAEWIVWLVPGSYEAEFTVPVTSPEQLTGTMTCTIVAGEGRVLEQTQIDLQEGGALGFKSARAGWIIIRIDSGPAGAVVGVVRLTRPE